MNTFENFYSLRKHRGWRLKIDDDGSTFKAILWQGQGDSVITHRGKGETIDAAIEKALENLALSNLEAHLREKGVL